MSTRGVIARTLPEDRGEGAFEGVYNHSDSYPTWMGPHLWKLVQPFGGQINLFLHHMLDKHKAGWSTVGEECYCHPKRDRAKERAQPFITHENTANDLEWLWVFNPETNQLHVIDHRNDNTHAGTVELDGPEPTAADWMRMECGEELERCSHYAWVHFPELSKGPMSRLGTAKYLGREPMDFHDAVAVIVQGKRYSMGGSGYLSDIAYMRGAVYPRGLWISSVKAANGRRLDMPVAYAEGDYKPYRGVQWVYPPTKDNPEEIIVGL